MSPIELPEPLAERFRSARDYLRDRPDLLRAAWADRLLRLDRFLGPECTVCQDQGADEGCPQCMRFTP